MNIKVKNICSLILFLVSLVSYAQDPAKNSENDSLLTVWQDDALLDSVRIDAYVSYIKNTLFDQKPESAFRMAEELLKFSRNRKSRFGEAEALHLQGRTWDDRKDFEKAIDYYQNSIKIREEIGDKSGMSASVFNIGLMYETQGEYSKAIEYYERSLNLDEEVGNKSYMSSTLNSLSHIYREMGNNPKAIECLERSVIINEDIGNRTEAALGLCNIGINYSGQGDRTTALDYFERSLEILEEIDHKQGRVQLLANIGVIYHDEGDFPKALGYYERSKEIYEEMGNRLKVSQVQTTMGIIFSEQGDYPKALEYYQASLKINEEIADTFEIANVTNNIGNVYKARKNYPKALEYYERALKINEGLEKIDISGQLSNMGIIYKDQGDYPKAMDYCMRALKIREELEDKSGISISLNNIGTILYEQDNNSEALDYYQRSFKLREELGDKPGIVNSLRNIGEVFRKQGKNSKAIDYCSQSLDMAESLGSVSFQQEACQCLYHTYKGMEKSNEALLYLEKSAVLEDSLKAEETALKLQQMEFAKVMLADSLKDEGEKQNLQMAHDSEVTKTNRQRNIFIISGLLALILAAGFFSRWRYVKKSRDQISTEKDRSENILLNILPADIAEELKIKGSAEARDFDQVSILFTDFKEFTQMSEQLSPKELVNEINYCFKVFDDICEKYGIEKIKTIGDSYMAAGGLPAPSLDSTLNIVSAALEMSAFVVERKAERNSKGLLGFEMRSGIHTGNVVAGIVGVKKFQYDVWGDTVNTASRIESHGEIGKVNISQSTYELIKEAPKFTFMPRGKINAKGKGEIEMYFVSKV